MSKCQLCPLHVESEINLISGAGPQPAQIMFIVEAPGEDEARSGKPLTGPAGQLFDRLLMDAGIDRNQVRITSVARCRPIDKTQVRTDRRGGIHYGNRAPLPEEVYVCGPTYLDKEIEATKPNIIVPVGNTALHYVQSEYSVGGYDQNTTTGIFTPKLTKTGGKLQNIMAERGVERWNTKYNCKQISIIHPSALLRGAKQLNVTVEDLRRIKEAATAKEVPVKIAGEYVVIDTWDMVLWALERLEASTEFAFDVETTGFDWMRDRLICIGFSWKERTGVSIRIIDEQGNQLWDADQTNILKSRLNALFRDSTKCKIGQNLKFDAHHLMSWGICYPRNSFDTMLAHHMLDSDTEHGLKTMAWIFTDMGGYEDELDKYFVGKTKAEKNFLTVPRDMLGKYNGMDCDCTLRLKHRFEKDMAKFPNMESFFKNWVTEFSETVLIIERSGAPIDFARILDIHTRMGQRCYEIEQSFKQELGLAHADELNLNSTKQLREVFFNTLKLTPNPAMIGKSGPSLDEEALLDLVVRYPDNKLVTLVSDYRSLQKSMSTYLEGLKNSALFGRSMETRKEDKETVWTPEEARGKGYITDCRVHCDYLLQGTATGRLSSRNPNLQNIPRVTKEDIARGFVIRSVFIAELGHKLVVIDLSSAELWMLYAFSKDELLRQALESEEGVHLNFASRLFNKHWKEIVSEEKAIAKTVVFGIAYGRGAQSISEQFKIPLAKAQAYVDGFHQSFPAASYWMTEWIKKARIEKKVWSPFGRVRHLPAIDSPHYGAKLDSEHQAVNFPIQSAASDITQIAGTRVRQDIQALALKSQPIWTTHDENAWHVPDSELKIMSEIGMKHMQAFVPEIGIATKAKMDIYTRWKEGDH